MLLITAPAGIPDTGIVLAAPGNASSGIGKLIVPEEKVTLLVLEAVPALNG